jgi:tetratricopeptide (TPR) repeat protein
MEVIQMPSLPVQRSERRHANTAARFLPILLVIFLPVAVLGQGSGRDSTGTGGNHIIQGKVFFPSGRRAEGAIQIKLQSNAGNEISVMADSSGSFSFSSLSPGNYTVVVNAGDDYEISREGVTIDSDLNLSRAGVSLNSGTRRYTVMVTLQLKRDSGNRTRPSVVNAALAEVPENARALYEKGLELAKAGDSLKAIDNLRAAISLFPRFPLALNELGVQYLKLGQAGRAVEPLKSAVKLSPDASTPKLNLGIALLETQQFTEAETQLREALKINSAPTGHMYLGLTLAHLHRDAEAEKELKTAIDSSGNQLGLAHYYLGGLYWRRSSLCLKNAPCAAALLAADELETYLRLTPNAQDAEKVRNTIKELRSKS